MQRQQDLEREEAAHSRKIAAMRQERDQCVLAVAREIEASRMDIYGPTGQNLDEQQRVMQQAGATSAAGARRPPRWGRPSSDERGRTARRQSPESGRRARTKTPRPSAVAASAAAPMHTE